MAEAITRGGVVWRWVRMACSVFKDGQVQMSQRLETASFLCSSPVSFLQASVPRAYSQLPSSPKHGLRGSWRVVADLG